MDNFVEVKRSCTAERLLVDDAKKVALLRIYLELRSDSASCVVGRRMIASHSVCY